ncbi:hypothetical protein [Streptomyces aidingensis]|uniref:Glycosyltransferase, catalytic subunit of cellulose synthase and poly-beta-1,6-N-acetylglucosamine synthase n=1 Tax=Streptomyces aidingensis TaxID=910347 RepID=A0A1I1NVM9_9ACTN|nr:hypothetical protein [Streptomyces aidingensis]SFD01731.1 hypothetical protein SAMN05421773_108193 [Streptomyces aidingensis]
MADLWFTLAVPTLLVALLARACWAMAATELCARWLLSNSRPSRAEAGEEAPWLVVLLPMLREQAVAPETIAAFTALPYPKGRAAVVVITTERERTARERARTRLPDLAAARPLRPARLGGLFPAARCEPVAHAVNAAPPKERLALLIRLFDAEATTAQVVADATARLPESSLRLVHLHQPATPGRKAGQLNFALDRIGAVLGPLGWDQDRDEDHTFVAVYDADAVPDRDTLAAFADTAQAHRERTGQFPALIQQQRLPLAARRRFSSGPGGLLLAGEWIYQLRRSLGIELARVRLHQQLTVWRAPEMVKMWLRPMVYAVGCGMAVHLTALRAVGGFPEPMEDLGTGHRLSLAGAALAPSSATVLDEPYTVPGGLTNLHALAFTASARPDRHLKAITHLPRGLPRPSQWALVAREYADQAAWLLGAPLTAAAVLSSPWAGPWWTALAAAGVLLHGPALTARLLTLAPALHGTVHPPGTAAPSPPELSPARRALLVAASPLQPFIRLAGPWRMIFRRMARRPHGFGKTER